ncbi:MAG: hypothetical protein RJA86_1901 [Pseudomonadota bacterium]|nr:hypothetical protein [Agitococcus sp.]
MSKAKKMLEAMRNNPRDDWRLEQLQTVARRYGITWRHESSSHCIFIAPDGRTLPVPAKRPVKPVYITLFVAFIGEAEPVNED